MSTAFGDPLYAVFEENLHSGIYDEALASQFVQAVVELYWEQLTRAGHVPLLFHEPLKVDFTQEVNEMLRAKIYGYGSIAEYNLRRRTRRD